MCLVGCADLSIDAETRACRIAQHAFHEGDWLTLDGNEGLVYAGRLETISERPDRELAIIRTWQAT